MRTQSSTQGNAWVTLTEACRMLGVSPSTVRRWADGGVIRTFVTPGGHRRFSRAGVESLLPVRQAGHPTPADVGETSDRMTRRYRRWGDEDPGRIPWVAELEADRRERFRAYGRRIVSALMDALDAADPGMRTERLRDAEDTCAEYGRVAGREGLGAPMAADLFLRFRRPFIAELAAAATRSELDAAAACSLTADATQALDGLLLATLRGWESAALGVRRRPRQAVPAVDPTSRP
jgi:excisionase family DNA binding protein